MTKTIVGYCEPFSARPGQQVELKLSATEPAQCLLDVVRLVCGDPSSKGPGFREELVARPDVSGPSHWPTSIKTRTQPLHPGSSAEIPTGPWLEGLRSCTVQVLVHPTRFGGGAQQLLRVGEDSGAGTALRLGIDHDGRLTLEVAGQRLTLDRPLTLRRWWRVTAGYDATFGQLRLRQVPLPSGVPSDALVLHEAAGETTADELIGCSVGGPVPIAGPFDGRFEDPLLVDGCTDDPESAVAVGAVHARCVVSLGI